MFIRVTIALVPQESEGAKLGEPTTVFVTIVSDENLKRITDQVAYLLKKNIEKFKIGRYQASFMKNMKNMETTNNGCIFLLLLLFCLMTFALLLMASSSSSSS